MHIIDVQATNMIGIWKKSKTTDKTSLHPYINIGVYPRQMSQLLDSFTAIYCLKWSPTNIL